MKNIVFAVCLISSSSVFATNNTGSISGTVNYCDKGAIAGMQVFIPGKPHVVITGSDGRFSFTNLPAGKHQLNFMLNGGFFIANKQAEVTSAKDTWLGLINVCSVLANQAEPGDSSEHSAATTQLIPTIFGGANCAKADDGVLFLINHGKGECQEGIEVVKSCDAGFANCDEKISNGCEIDTNNDIEHCGGCFNACASLESCEVGIC